MGLNAQSQGGERRRRTYAVLIVHVVNFVDSQPLPLVQLLFLEGKRQICDENRCWLSNEGHLNKLTAHHARLTL